MKERLALIAAGIALGLFYAYVWVRLPLWVRGVILVIWWLYLFREWYQRHHKK